tara:strand:- start:181 stop:411 length:231 start_codon:yes stop_codon:yes gene_type:complete
MDSSGITQKQSKLDMLTVPALIALKLQLVKLAKHSATVARDMIVMATVIVKPIIVQAAAHMLNMLNNATDANITYR